MTHAGRVLQVEPGGRGEGGGRGSRAAGAAWGPALRAPALHCPQAPGIPADPTPPLPRFIPTPAPPPFPVPDAGGRLVVGGAAGERRWRRVFCCHAQAPDRARALRQPGQPAALRGGGMGGRGCERGGRGGKRGRGGSAQPEQPEQGGARNITHLCGGQHLRFWRMGPACQHSVPITLVPLGCSFVPG